jgi:hypothetical protein
MTLYTYIKSFWYLYTMSEMKKNWRDKFTLTAWALIMQYVGIDINNAHYYDSEMKNRLKEVQQTLKEQFKRFA